MIKPLLRYFALSLKGALKEFKSICCWQITSWYLILLTFDWNILHVSMHDKWLYFQIFKSMLIFREKLAKIYIIVFKKVTLLHQHILKICSAKLSLRQHTPGISREGVLICLVYLSMCPNVQGNILCRMWKVLLFYIRKVRC